MVGAGTALIFVMARRVLPALARALGALAAVPVGGGRRGRAAVRRPGRRVAAARGRPPAVDRRRAAEDRRRQLVQRRRVGGRLSLAAYLAFYGVTFWFAGRTLARELGHGAVVEEPAPAGSCPPRPRADVLMQTAWFIAIALLWALYLVLEGFDFGVGMLLRRVRGDQFDRRVALHAIGPTWAANEVWLVIAVVAMFGAFPGWYAAWSVDVLPAPGGRAARADRPQRVDRAARQARRRALAARLGARAAAWPAGSPRSAGA